jgi:hypothetical protein
MFNQISFKFAFFLLFFYFFDYALRTRVRRTVRPKRTSGRGPLSGCPLGHPNGPKRTAQRIRLGRVGGDALTAQKKKKLPFVRYAELYFCESLFRLVHLSYSLWPLVMLLNYRKKKVNASSAHRFPTSHSIDPA